MTQILGWSAGALLLALGLWAMGGRKDLQDTEKMRRLSPASRAVLGLVLMFAGYHVAAYVSPDKWLSLRVPRERAWIMGLVMLVGVGASLLMDWKQRGRQAPVGGSGSGE